MLGARRRDLVCFVSLLLAGCAGAPHLSRSPAEVDFPPLPPARRPDRTPLPLLPICAVSPKAQMISERDPRLAHGKPMRDDATIRADLARLRAELDASARASGERLDLLVRIADAHAERANVADAIPPTINACSFIEARADAVDAYRNAVTELRAANDPRSDKASYYLLLEIELAGHGRGLVRSYRRLVQDAEADMRPYALFGLAEILWIHNRDRESAREYYEKVLQLPSNAMTKYALLRMAQLIERGGDVRRAAGFYRRLAREFPGSDAALEGRSIP